jgi:excisionase family DNA binding protein
MQLTVRDVASLLNVLEKTVRRWISERGLPGHQLSGQDCFNQMDLIGCAMANRANGSPAMFHEFKTLGPVPAGRDGLMKTFRQIRPAGSNRVRPKLRREGIIQLSPAAAGSHRGEPGRGSR